MRKWKVKRVVIDGLGWERNENSGNWEMYHKGNVKWYIEVKESTVIHDFINYNWENK